MMRKNSTTSFLLLWFLFQVVVQIHSFQITSPNFRQSLKPNNRIIRKATTAPVASSDAIIPIDKTTMAQAAEQQQRRRRAAKISHSFATRDFQPAWYATNPHLQTLVGVFARQETSYAPSKLLSFFQKEGPIKAFQWDERERMETPDGDFFHVDYKYVEGSNGRIHDDYDYEEEKEEVPLVLIVHGLQSNSESPLVKDMTNAFNAIGMDVACINFRGCSGEINATSPLGYHLSFTDDLQQMVEHISTTFPMRPIYLSGFSLGANVVTKFLADIEITGAERYNICGAAVNAVPFDLVKVAPNLSDPGLPRRSMGIPCANR
jgi:predicted alpha/beta-fold hydrolase